MSVRLCHITNNHKLYMTIRILFFFSICGSAATLLEVVNLWGSRSGSIPRVLLRG